MKVFLALFGILAALQCILLAISIGVASLLRLLMPELSLNAGMLVALISTIASVFLFLQIPKLLPFSHVVCNDWDEEEDEEEDEYTPPSPRRSRQRQQKKR